MDLADVVCVEVVGCSSEDPPHAGKRLNSDDGVPVLRDLLDIDTTVGGITAAEPSGWQAEKLCEYPQEIVFRVSDPDVAPPVSSLVVVSHATLVAHRIEIFLSSTVVRDWRKARFKRLGFISLQSPHDTHCTAHELKTVPLSLPATEKLTFFKLLVHTCHVHTANVFDQVGLACCVLLANNPTRQCKGVSLVAAVKRRLEAGRESIEAQIEPLPRLRPWPTAVSRLSKSNQRRTPASHAVWIAERNEYVTPVELLTRIQLARERHAVIPDQTVANFQRNQRQWAADEYECVRLVDTLAQLESVEAAARTVDERLHAQKQMDVALQSVTALDARVCQREALLQRLVRDVLKAQLDNSPVKSPSSKLSPTKTSTVVFRDKDTWVSLDPWQAREEFLWRVVEAVKRWGNDDTTPCQKNSLEPKDCMVLDEAIEITIAGLKDAHTQVFIAATALLVSVIQRHPRFQGGSAWKQELALVLKLLACRLDDHQPPVRNNAAFSLIKVADLTRARGTFVVHALLVLTERQEIQMSSQTLYGLLKVFSVLLASFHCCATIDISVKRMLRFLIKHDALVHENGHVRDAARQLLVVLHSDVGSEPILTYLRQKKNLSNDFLSDIEQLLANLTGRSKLPASLDGATGLG